MNAQTEKEQPVRTVPVMSLIQIHDLAEDLNDIAHGHPEICE